MSTKAKYKAFTLVELLVVVTIISVLAAMLLPALSEAVESARIIACANTEKQLGMTVFRFAEDYDGYLPCSRYATSKDANHLNELFPAAAYISGSTRGWSKGYESNLFNSYYVEDLGYKNLVCPSHPERNTFLKNPNWQQVVTYLINADNFSECCLPNWNYYVRKERFASVRNASKLFMFLELGATQDGDAFQASYMNSVEFGRRTFGNTEHPHRKGKGMNSVYFDGHSEFIAPDREPLWGTDTEKDTTINRYVITGAGYNKRNWLNQ